MKKFLILLLLPLALSCSLDFYVHTRTDLNEMDTMETVNLDDYTFYYRVIFKHEDSLERVSKDTSVNNANHIFELQYILLHNDGKKFIHITSMAPRSLHPKKGFYLDYTARNYQSVVNIFNTNQLYYGTVKDNKMFFDFKKEAEKRYLKFKKPNNNELRLCEIEYLNNSEIRNVALDSIMVDNYLLFYKMSDPKIVFLNRGVDEDKIHAALKKEIQFLKTGEKGFHRISFHFVTPVKWDTDEDSLEAISFRKTSTRFNFIYPLDSLKR